MARKKTIADELYNARRILKRQNERLNRQLESASTADKKILSETIARNERKIESLKVNRKRGIDQSQLGLSRVISGQNEKLRRTETPKQANRTILARSYINNNRAISGEIYSYLSTKKKGKQATEKDAIREAWKLKKQADPNAIKPDLLESYEILSKHISGLSLSEARGEPGREYDPSPIGILKAQREVNHNVSTNTKGQLTNAKRRAKNKRKKKRKRKNK